MTQISASMHYELKQLRMPFSSCSRANVLFQVGALQPNGSFEFNRSHKVTQHINIFVYLMIKGLQKQLSFLNKGVTSIYLNSLKGNLVAEYVALCS